MKEHISFNGKHPKRIFRWSLDFSTERESFAPVWIRLPMLKSSFCTSVEALKQLSKPIGIFMAADSATLNFTRPS